MPPLQVLYFRSRTLFDRIGGVMMFDSRVESISRAFQRTFYYFFFVICCNPANWYYAAAPALALVISSTFSSSPTRFIYILTTVSRV